MSDAPSKKNQRIELKGRVPAVFMYQPTHYERIEDSEGLKQWERDLVERVGLKAQLEKGNERMRAVATKCVCGDRSSWDGFDDCDVEWI